MKKNNSYDVFFILVLLSLLFSIGYGIERGTPEVEKAYVTVSVRITELKGTPSEDNVYFLDGETFYGETDRELCSTDLIHPNDIGFLRMAEKIEPIIKALLNK